MKQLESLQSGMLLQLARLVDARSLVLMLAVWLFVTPVSRDGLPAWLDARLFDVANLLQQPSLDGTPYLRVNVSPAEMQQFLRDPAGGEGVGRLLQALEESYVQTVAMVLPGPLPARTRTEELLGSDLAGRLTLSDGALEGHLRQVAARWKALDAALVDSRYLFALVQPVEAKPPRTVLGLSLAARGTYGAMVDPTPVLPPDFPPLARQAPLLAPQGLASPLFWQAGSGLRPDALLELYMRQHGLKDVDFQDSRHVRLGPETVIRASAQGIFYPRVTVADLDQAGVLQITLGSLLQQNIKRAVHGKNLVIGVEKDPAADRLLTGLVSLNQDFHASLPHEYLLVHAAVLLAIVLLALLVPYLSLRVNLLLFVLLLGGVCLFPLVMLVGEGWWLPAGQWLCFLVGSFILMVLWSLKHGCFDVERDWLAFLRWRPAWSVRSRQAAPDRARTEPVVDQPTTAPVPGPRRRALVTERDTQLVGFTDEVETMHVADTRAMDAATIRETRGLPADEGSLPPAFFRKGTDMPASRLHSTMRPVIRKIGKYDIRAELGRGAMGIVYRGYDAELHRDVAIKTLQYSSFEPDEREMMKQRFFAEARAAGKLRHPNIVTFHEVNETREMAYIVMDYVAGTSLASYTNKANLLDVDTVYWIVAEIADALDYAHAAGLVHRDVKPSNILYDPVSNEVKIADFGIAKNFDSSLHHTRTGEVLGSPLYMSPEQVRGEPVTGKSDLFSLGVTLYQLLTGELPFKADNIAALTRLILQCKFTPVDELRPDLPPSARKITNKAMQRKPDDRYPHGGDMALALDQARQRETAR